MAACRLDAGKAPAGGCGRIEGVRMKRKILVLVAGLLMATMAHAVCYRDGKPYPTGAVVDGYVCLANGSWTRR
jgi:hypothetical protein